MDLRKHLVNGRRHLWVGFPKPIEEPGRPVMAVAQLALERADDQLVPAQPKRSCAPIDGVEERLRKMDAGGHEYVCE